MLNANVRGNKKEKLNSWLTFTSFHSFSSNERKEETCALGTIKQWPSVMVWKFGRLKYTYRKKKTLKLLLHNRLLIKIKSQRGQNDDSLKAQN